MAVRHVESDKPRTQSSIEDLIRISFVTYTRGIVERKLAGGGEADREVRYGCEVGVEVKSPRCWFGNVLDDDCWYVGRRVEV